MLSFMPTDDYEVFEIKTRPARAKDAAGITRLIGQLGYERIGFQRNKTQTVLDLPLQPGGESPESE
jgi:hypothetical protein